MLTDVQRELLAMMARGWRLRSRHLASYDRRWDMVKEGCEPYRPDPASVEALAREGLVAPVADGQASPILHWRAT